ncbi:winged helix-turn-helix domain-containing protein [Nitrosopumilus adriaticus]|uniref:Restriction system protein Mrr-like N-terminal domain-containing protein n=1 Tax=Nitrosopumilus adriaticus TaxID=1580092 RepID=A0A0D5C3C3_9ARCH|nr:winged helix-turn-helix domain-containing protein [Nitrosopumilus adriaticus]AJW71058.1 hypothetical protein NADRNF5_1372 [Nitrosopumilus adriaticus]
MAKIDFERLMWPMLEIGSNNEISVSDAETKLAKQFKLTEKQRNQRKKSGPETKLKNRAFWARNYLEHAGLVTVPKRGYYQTTKLGKKLLKKNLEYIDTKYLMDHYKKFRDFYNTVLESKKLARQQRKSETVPKQTGIVVFLDALGTKGIWNREKEKNKIINSWSTYTKNFEQEIKKLNTRDYSFMTFSDTIIIAIQPYNKQKTLFELSPILSSAIIDSMILERPIRGSISFGDYYYKGNEFIIGKAIDEAVEYNTIPQWIGISAAPSAHSIIENMPKSQLESRYKKYDIPTKETLEQNAWVVDWASTADNYIEDVKFEKRKKKFQNTAGLLKNNISKVLDINANIKWRNTQKFFETVN